MTGFPTAWYGFPIAGAQTFSSLTGTVTVDNSQSLYAEVLFILQYLPSGACPSGPWPSSTPEYGPPGAQPLGQFIVKAPTQGTFTVPINVTLPGGLPMSSCVLLGLNGGPVSATHDVVSSADLSLAFTAPQPPPGQRLLGAGGEFCFGQNWGCQAATTDDSQSLAAGDCLVTLWGLQGGGGFDNETQVFALTAP